MRDLRECYFLLTFSYKDFLMSQPSENKSPTDLREYLGTMFTWLSLVIKSLEAKIDGMRQRNNSPLQIRRLLPQDDAESCDENERDVDRDYWREDLTDSNSIKIEILSFNWQNDTKTYLEWEWKVELIFDCHNYSEEKKVKLAVVVFTAYALVWCVQVLTNRRYTKNRSVSTWRDIKSIIRKIFVPSYYRIEMYQKLRDPCSWMTTTPIKSFIPLVVKTSFISIKFQVLFINNCFRLLWGSLGDFFNRSI